MRIATIINKNLRLLIRSKSSAFVVIIGPLFLLVLISLLFSQSEELSFSIGIVSSNGTGIGDFTKQIKSGPYTIIESSSIQECTKKISLGEINACIEFPEKIDVKNSENNINFYVDQSRINFVPTVISKVSETIGITSEEISMSLTNNILNVLGITSKEVSKGEGTISDFTSNIDLLKTNVNSVKDFSSLSEVSSASEDISKISSKLKTIKNSAGDINTNGSSEEVDNINSATNDIEKIISEVSSSLKSIKSNINNVQSKTDELKAGLTTLDSKRGSIKNNFEIIKSQISSIKVNSAKNIVNPVNFNVKPILSNSNKSLFLFPYIIGLFILFVGMLLAGTLIVMEKQSEAHFRTFTTPSNKFEHLSAGFITTVLIVSFQLIVVFSISYFMHLPIFSSLYITSIILLLSISLFAIFGMILGTIFSTQEGINIASISIGSLLLLLSNLILPIESFSLKIQKVLSLNPYLISTELIKKTVLFGSKFKEVRFELGYLLIYVFVLLTLLIIIQLMSLRKTFILNRKELRKERIKKIRSYSRKRY